MPDATRRLAAILAADVAAYSRHVAMDEARTLTELRLLRNDILAPRVAEYRGEIVKSMGDGWLIAFASVVDAVGCAIEVQKQLIGQELIQLRMGIHAGDVVHEDEDIYGDGVNIAARLQETAEPGGVLVSDIAYRSLDKGQRELFAALGARSLKNIPSAVLLFGWRGGPHLSVGEAEAVQQDGWVNTGALIAALARTGDREAFAELVTRHQSRVRNQMRRACGDATLADDLAQQTFLKAWRNIRHLRQPHLFKAWLRRLAINTWLEHARRSDAMRDAIDIDEAELAQASASGVAIDLDGALAALSEPVRLCIVLAYHEGMTHEEIAEHAGMPLGTVKSHLNRGTERLRRILSVYQDTPHVEEPDGR